MVTRARRGSALQITMIVLMVIFTLGSALLSMTTSALLRSRNDMLRAQALDVAEAGTEKAVYYVRNTAPDGSVNGSWRTTGQTESFSSGSYTFSVADGTGDDAGKIVIICTGQVTLGNKTTSRRLRLVITRTEENVSPWNNVIFAGVGQAGKSINGNVVMRGSVHLLGEGEPYTDVDGDGHWDDDEPYIDSNLNGRYDVGEPYTDIDHDGHRDAREPFTDLNGNGVYDPPLTVTDLADDISGTADVGNNYNGMSASLQALIPSCPTVTFGGETVQSLSAKLRVKHGKVNISGSATVGDPNATGNAVKETMNGCFVNDGYGGTAGTGHVYSDNGFTKGYDLGDIVQFPDLVSPETIDGVSYGNHMEYLQDTGLVVSGPLNLQPDVAYSASDAYGNSLLIDGHGNMTIHGIIYVSGNINLNRGSGSGNGTFTYSGKGTLATTGTLSVHTNVLPVSNFPVTNAIGMIARHQLQLATGSGDSQLQMLGAFYAQEQIQSQKQNEIAGTFVSSYFSMTNVPHMYQVPALATNLPPGMPGATPIWVVTTQVNSWHEVAPS